MASADEQLPVAPVTPRGHGRLARVGGPRCLSTVVVGVGVALLLVAVGCGRDSTATSSGSSTPASSGQIQGMQRGNPLQVGAVTLPEVKPGSPDVPFPMKADANKLLFVYFGYTNCPDLCPTTLSDLRKALKQLGAKADAVEVSFVTVDPTRDTPEVLVPYLGSFVTGGHALRTTDPAQLRAAEDAFLASSTVTSTPDHYDVSHTAVSYIVDPTGKVLVEWPFGVTPETMASDLSILLTNQTKENTR